MVPVTKSTDLLDGPQYKTKCLLPEFNFKYSSLILQNSLIRATPVNVFPVPKTKNEERIEFSVKSYSKLFLHYINKYVLKHLLSFFSSEIIKNQSSKQEQTT